MESLGADGSSRLTEFDPLDRAPWTTLTSTFDRNGEQTGVFREFDDPDRWLAQHILNMNHLAGYDEPAAENLIASIEREAIRGPALDEGLPSPISYEPRFGSAYDFSEGDFNLDWDPHEGSADVDLSGDLNGWDDSWADSWEDIDWGDEDNDWGGDDTDWGGWGDFFPTDYDIGSWEGGDWGPVVIDLNGDGVDIVAREDSPVYFNLDGDAALEKTAWAGRTAPA